MCFYISKIPFKSGHLNWTFWWLSFFFEVAVCNSQNLSHVMDRNMSLLWLNFVPRKGSETIKLIKILWLLSSLKWLLPFRFDGIFRLHGFGTEVPRHAMTLYIFHHSFQAESRKLILSFFFSPCPPLCSSSCSDQALCSHGDSLKNNPFPVAVAFHFPRNDCWSWPMSFRTRFRTIINAL